MTTEHTITNVAREMTTLARRPDVRRRVMASIDETTRETGSRSWLVPVSAGAALVCVAAVAAWVMSAPGAVDRAPARVASSPAPAPFVTADARGTEPPAASAARPGVVSRLSSNLAAADLPVFVAEPADDIPTLPLLAPPPAVAVAPVAWDAVVIAPLDVAAIEIRAISIEPIGPDDGSGA